MAVTEDFFIPNLNSIIHRTELTIKRSRFIASAYHTRGIDEAKSFIEMIRTEFADARHHCYAFNAGNASSTAAVGCSDDGEPSGSAGQPMLNVLIHSGIGEITIVVTRYFGGTLLGIGGLVKAYQDSIKGVIRELPLKKFVAMKDFYISAPVMFVSQIIYLIKNFGGAAGELEFAGENVQFSGNIPADSVILFTNALKDITKARAIVTYDNQ